MLTREQQIDITQRAHAALTAGESEQSLKIRLQLPLAPHLAKAAKEIWGKDFLLSAGFNLSEAEVTYGKTWLDC